MHAIVEALQQILDTGAKLGESAQPEMAELLSWMTERERVFGELGRIAGDLAEDEKSAVQAAGAQILGVDALVIDALEAQKKLLSQEITLQQKLKAFIDGGKPAKAWSMERLA